jgi:hypothetical protein
MTERPDQAALASAAIAAAVSLALGSGRFGWLSTGIGTVLVSLLLAYYRPSLPSPGSARDAVAKALAFGGTAGLLVALVASWPIQLIVGTPERCGGGAPSEVADCAGGAASPWVGWTFLFASVVLGGLHYWRVHPESLTG